MPCEGGKVFDPVCSEQMSILTRQAFAFGFARISLGLFDIEPSE